MTEFTTTKTEQPADGVVERLARDDVERKKFLKMAGKKMGAGAAATGLAAFIAACGSSSSSSSSTATSAPAAPDTSSGGGSSDLTIVNYALTLEYLESQFYAKVAASGLFKGKTLSLLKSFGAEEDQHVIALKKVAHEPGHARGEADGQVPARGARRRSPSWPRPSRTSAPPPTSARRGTSRARRSSLRRWRSTRSRRATRRRSTR